MISGEVDGAESARCGPGALNLVKLCVGAEGVADLAAWRAQRAAERRAAGLPPRVAHQTRQTPKRFEELLDGGSLYWVFKGRILARQRLIAIEPVSDGRGVDLVRQADGAYLGSVQGGEGQTLTYSLTCHADLSMTGNLQARDANITVSRDLTLTRAGGQPAPLIGCGPEAGYAPPQ